MHRLGQAIWSLVPSRPVALTSLVDHFHEETRDDSFSESVALAWREGEGAVIVADAPSDHLVRVNYDTGRFRSPETVDARVLTAGDGTGDEDLEQIRETGYLEARGPDIVELAAPICRDGVRPVAALLVGIPAHRADETSIGSLVSRLLTAAARLSHQLGAASYQPFGWNAGRQVLPSSEMSLEDLDAFLQGPWSAQLGCVREDGTPHVVPLWYEWDGEVVWLAGSPAAAWRDYIEADPQVSVTLDEPWPPLRRVFMSGTATEVSSSSVEGGLVGLRARLARKYLGRGADQQPELTDVEGWAVIRVTLESIRGRQGLGQEGLAATQ